MNLFPIYILMFLGLFFSLYKFYKSDSKVEKKQIILKYLIYILYFLVFVYFLYPAYHFTKASTLIFFSLLLLKSLNEIYKIKYFLKWFHFMISFFIFFGVLLLLVYIKNFILLLNVFYCVFIFDGVSQIGGQIFGKNKLALSVSPNKTWEGFIIGFVISILSMWFIDGFNDFIFINNKYFNPLFYSLICVFALIGDLFFSKLKRLAKIKDFGSFLPGHGGVLDRIDGLIVSFAFIFYIYFIILFFFICKSDGPSPIF